MDLQCQDGRIFICLHLEHKKSISNHISQQTIIQTSSERPRCARNARNNPIGWYENSPANLKASIIEPTNRPSRFRYSAFRLVYRLCRLLRDKQCLFTLYSVTLYKEWFLGLFAKVLSSVSGTTEDGVYEMELSKSSSET